MRGVRFVLVGVVLLAVGYGLGRRYPQAGTGGPQRRILYYVDPMHPTYKSDKPGIAPDCGMKLEAVFAGNASHPLVPEPLAQLSEGAVSIDGATQRLLGIQLASVEKRSVTRVVRVIGRVVPEDTRIYRINSGVDGFIRATYNDSVGTRVSKNQKLASYYAPEFIAAASGFLAANERMPGAVAKEGARSIQNYTDRLRNLGMSDEQISHMAETRQLPDSIDVVAPADGFIMARSISAGQHFTHEMEFYSVADLSRVWVAAEIPAQEASMIRPGSSAQLVLPGQGHLSSAHIADSLPQSEAGGGTVKLRLEADNPEFLLRPEMSVDVEIPVRMASTVNIPLDALLDSGASARVYVEHGDGIFEPRIVKTGWRFDQRVEILQGLRPGERVVASATFLVDSESRLKAQASGSASAVTAAATSVVRQGS